MAREYDPYVAVTFLLIGLGVGALSGVILTRARRRRTIDAEVASRTAKAWQDLISA